MASKKQESPSHLATATRRWFSEVAADYELESHHMKILEMAAQAWDEYESARKAVTKHGQIFVDRYGQPRERPEVSIARQARTAFARLIRELALDVESPTFARPPRLGGQRY